MQNIQVVVDLQDIFFSTSNLLNGECCSSYLFMDYLQQLARYSLFNNITEYEFEANLPL